MTVDGDVVAVHSFWTADRSRIVTDATVRTPDGDVVVRQQGGSAEGIETMTIPGPEPLAVGMKVAIAAHRDVDLSQREHVVLDSAKVLAYPPGYARTRSNAGRPLHWESGCVFVTVDSAGTSAIPGDGEFAAIDAAIATWNNAVASCSYMQIISEPRRPVEVHSEDRVNAILFRDTSWCHPKIGDDAQYCHPELNAAAVAHVSRIENAGGSNDGAIVDVDIEFNGVHVPIVIDGEPMRPGCAAEVQNTLTHELGHLLGLSHPCVNPGDPMVFDHLGNPAPDCFFVPRTSPLRETTMWFSQECGETQKEDLAPDDIQAICEIYATQSDPGTCEPVSEPGGCCSAAGSDRPEVGFLLAGTVLLVLRARGGDRRSRRRR